MEQQQLFSPGLLYSVAPESFAELHLDSETRHDEFDWDEHESERMGEPLTRVVLSFLKITVIKWGLSKP